MPPGRNAGGLCFFGPLPPMPGESKEERLQAFNGVVAAFEGPLLRYAARLTNSAAAAEDVVQNAFVKFIRLWKGPYETSGEVSAWLYRVVHNEAIDLIRNEARRKKLHEEHGHEAFSHPLEEPDPGDAALDAAKALERLSERERALVILKVYEEKSYKEIAEITGLTVSNVGVILHGAMKKLANALKGKERTDGE